MLRRSRYQILLMMMWARQWLRRRLSFEHIQRLQMDLLERVPDECIVRVARPEDPIISTWLGAANLARHEHVERLAVTKQEYEEHGAGWVARKFAAGLPIDT